MIFGSVWLRLSLQAEVGCTKAAECAGPAKHGAEDIWFTSFYIDILKSSVRFNHMPQPSRPISLFNFQTVDTAWVSI